jgi:hypothetical protein
MRIERDENSVYQTVFLCHKGVRNGHFVQIFVNLVFSTSCDEYR